MKEEFNGILTSKLSEVDIKLNAIKPSHQFLRAKCDTFRNEVGQVLKQNMDLHNKYRKLASRVRELEKKDQVRAISIDDLEQYGPREMVKIAGIPRSKDEDCEVIAINVGSKLGVEYEHDIIKSSYHILKKENASIIVKFKSRKRCFQEMLKKR